MLTTREISSKLKKVGASSLAEHSDITGKDYCHKEDMQNEKN